jgi:6-phosphogluconolactonase
LEKQVTKSAQLNRRAFVRMMGFAPVAARAGWARTITCGSRIAYLGTMPGPRAGLEAQHEIRVYRIAGERWNLQQVVACAAPACLTLHPNRPLLYVVNEVSHHEGLPTGTVETYTLDADGKLAFMNRRALSLSATAPRHLALSPDARNAIVAVHGGGAYNLLPIGDDGRLERVTGIVKETGCGDTPEHQHGAHPQMAAFDATGRRVLALDQGTERLIVLELQDDGLVVRQRYALDMGSGPRQMILHPAGRWLYVSRRDGVVCGYAYDPARGRISGHVERVEAGTKVTLALHPSGEFLYSADDQTGIRCWKVNAANGRLAAPRTRCESPGAVRAITVERDGSALIALSDALEGVVKAPIHSRSGQLGQPVLVASAPGLRSIAIV